jgi:hypothetical protein
MTVSEPVALAQKIEELEQPKGTERMEAGVTLGSADPRVPKAMPGERGPKSADVSAVDSSPDIEVRASADIRQHPLPISERVLSVWHTTSRPWG